MISSERAILFDIKEFALHDGPGVRTTVFFKGCPLRCLWCHNPEGLSPKIELMTKEARCLHCDRCRTECVHDECRQFGRCIYACPAALISICGKEWTADELMARLVKDADFLRDSGGGVTFSGGEPLMQHAFLACMLQRLKDANIHSAIETSGYADETVFRRIADLTDFVIMDLKLADPSAHKQYTGVSNETILKNARYLQESGKDHLFRTPLIPSITDTEENLAALREIVGTSSWEHLPYNTMAGAKYPMIGMKYQFVHPDDVK